MANVIIYHPDGDPTYRVSVTRKAHAELYPEWTIGEEEAEADFDVLGIPQPRRPRAPRRQKAAKPITKPAESAVPPETGS